MLTDRLSEAFALSHALHREQLRKGTKIPYISHPMAVCSFVLEHGGDEDTAIAALLHDAAEDQGGQKALDEIATRFGTRVGEIVKSCSDSLSDHGEKKTSWLERKRAYLDHLAHVDQSAALVTLADKVHNASAILSDMRRHGVQTLDRFTPTREQLLWYYSQVVQALSTRHPGLPVGKLAELVAQLRTAIKDSEHPTR